MPVSRPVGRAVLSLLALLALAACGLMRRPAPPPAAAPHYVLERAWQAGPVWFYPRESFALDDSGIGAVRSGPHPAGTTDGEVFDEDAMAAAHPTLQLPAVARVTNLENGRQILVRVNDRGPANPGRVVELTRRAGALLGVPPGGTAQMRVQVEEAPSRALAVALQGPDAQLKIAAAPRPAVQAESLAPPGGDAAPGRGAIPRAASSAADGPAAALPPARLPETVAQVAPQPGRIVIRAGDFGRAAYAEQRRARLAGIGARVERMRQGRGETYRVVAGPFATVAQADAALDRTIRQGVTDARIVVE